ncbi:hypothetical protein LPJ72_004259 [Coemansia sp. Benny D160-2]|nr:hypothetical protein LPJ72_004259 [Coemansia sp. Benny D160-2]
MLSANALASRFHTYHKYKYSAANETGDVKRGEEGEEDYDDSMLLASIRPPSALFGSEILPLRPYVPQRSTAAELEAAATPTARRPLQPAADIADTTQSMKRRSNRPPSMDLFGPSTVTSVETRDIAMPTGLLDSELPPVSPFFSRITPSDIEEAKETVRRASVSRRNTVGGNSHGRGVSWCSPSTAVDSSSSPVQQQHNQQNSGTPTRASIAGTLASWVPPDHHHQLWDPHALESPANRRGQARRHSTWHFGEGEGGSPSSTGSGADDACEWLKDQEPPLSPLFSSYYADKRKKIAAAVLATTTATKAASKDQKEQGSPSYSFGRLFKVDVYTLFSSPLQSASANTRKRPRVVVREFVGGKEGEGEGEETANTPHLVPVDSSDPDVLIAVKRYLSTLVPFGRKPANKQTTSLSGTRMAAPSKLIINGGGSGSSCTTEPAVSFIVSSNTDDGAAGGNSVSDKAVRSVDVEAMVEAYLPRVYALLDADPDACRSCPTTVASNNSSMATLTDQQPDSTSYIYQQQQQQACVQNQARQQRRPFSLSEESLRVASARLPITPEMRIPPPPPPSFTDGSRQQAANFSAQAQAMSTPSRQPRSKQPIKSIDQLREAMSSLNLRRGMPAKDPGRAAATPAVAGTPTNQIRRPSEPPRVYQEHQHQQQQHQQARRPAVLRRRSEIVHNRDTGREYAPVSQAAIPVAASASKTLPSAFQRTLRPRASFPAHRRSSEEVQLARTSVGSLASVALGSPRSRLSISSDRSSNTTMTETRPSLTAAVSSSRDLPFSTQQQQQQQLNRRPRAQSSRLDLRSRRDLTPLAPLRNGLGKDNAADPNARGQAIAGPNMMPPASAPRILSRPTLPPLAPAKSSSSSSSSSMVTNRLAARKSMINLNAGSRLSLAAVNGTGGVSYSQHRASYTAGSADRPHVQNAFSGPPTRLPTARRALSGDSQYSGSGGGSSIASSSYLSPMLTPPVRRSTEGPPPLANTGVVPHLVPRKLGRRHRLDIRGVFSPDDGESSSRSLQNPFGVYPF